MWGKICKNWLRLSVVLLCCVHVTNMTLFCQGRVPQYLKVHKFRLSLFYIHLIRELACSICDHCIKHLKLIDIQQFYNHIRRRSRAMCVCKKLVCINVIELEARLCRNRRHSISAKSVWWWHSWFCYLIPNPRAFARNSTNYLSWKWCLV